MGDGKLKLGLRTVKRLGEKKLKVFFSSSFFLFCFFFLSSKAEKVRESVVPIVEPVRGSVSGSSVLAGIHLLLGWHVLLAPYAKVAFNWTTTHGTPV